MLNNDIIPGPTINFFTSNITSCGASFIHTSNELTVLAQGKELPNKLILN